MDQYKVLDEIQNFYSNLFKNCDETLNDKNIPNQLKPLNFNKINDPDLGQAISVEDLANVFKKMKNGKSPGIDGISVDF